jgi:hypothetical protein
MEEMQLTTDLTWIEVQFMKKAVDVVENCRTTLKWTYAMAYYLQNGNQKAMFEDNQRSVSSSALDSHTYSRLFTVILSERWRIFLNCWNSPSRVNTSRYCVRKSRTSLCTFRNATRFSLKILLRGTSRSDGNGTTSSSTLCNMGMNPSAWTHHILICQCSRYPALYTMFPLFSSFTGIPFSHPIQLMCTIKSLSILSFEGVLIDTCSWQYYDSLRA